MAKTSIKCLLMAALALLTSGSVSAGAEIPQPFVLASKAPGAIHTALQPTIGKFDSAD